MPMKHLAGGCHCCGCSCTFFAESFAGQDSTDLGTDWSEVVGDWSRVNNTVQVGANSALLITIDDVPSSMTHYSVSADLYGGAEQNQLRVIVAYESATQYYFGELEFSQEEVSSSSSSPSSYSSSSSSLSASSSSLSASSVSSASSASSGSSPSSASSQSSPSSESSSESSQSVSLSSVSSQSSSSRSSVSSLFEYGYLRIGRRDGSGETILAEIPIDGLSAESWRTLIVCVRQASREQDVSESSSASSLGNPDTITARTGSDSVNAAAYVVGRKIGLGTGIVSGPARFRNFAGQELNVIPAQCGGCPSDCEVVSESFTGIPDGLLPSRWSVVAGNVSVVSEAARITIPDSIAVTQHAADYRHSIHATVRSTAIGDRIRLLMYWESGELSSASSASTSSSMSASSSSLSPSSPSSVSSSPSSVSSASSTAPWGTYLAAEIEIGAGTIRLIERVDGSETVLGTDAVSGAGANIAVTFRLCRHGGTSIATVVVGTNTVSVSATSGFSTSPLIYSGFASGDIVGGAVDIDDIVICSQPRCQECESAIIDSTCCDGNPVPSIIRLEIVSARCNGAFNGTYFLPIVQPVWPCRWEAIDLFVKVGICTGSTTGSFASVQQSLVGVPPLEVFLILLDPLLQNLVGFAESPCQPQTASFNICNSKVDFCVAFSGGEIFGTTTPIF